VLFRSAPTVSLFLMGNGITMSEAALFLSNRSSRLRIVYPQKTFKRKEFLRLRSGTFWKIETGIVRSLTWDEEGRMMTLGFWGEEDVVGTPLHRVKPYQVECLTDVQVSELSPESGYLLEALLVHAWKSEEFFHIVHQFYVADRFLGLLQWLAKQFGQLTPQGIWLNLHLTHQDFADAIGSSRITVTRLMNQFEREGKIKRQGKLLKICVNNSQD